jgi:hypothetical protein
LGGEFELLLEKQWDEWLVSKSSTAIHLAGQLDHTLGWSPSLLSYQSLQTGLVLQSHEILNLWKGVTQVTPKGIFCHFEF